MFATKANINLGVYDLLLGQVPESYAGLQFFEVPQPRPPP
jgi:hypothetical protein